MSKVYELQDDSVVVVIGSGAGGGTLSNELAQKGVDVVCLEAGRRLELSDIVHDPLKMDKKMGWLDRRDGSATWLCKTVGGTTMRWSAVALRFKAHEFRALSTYGQLPGASLIDWPLTLEEMEPWYDKAETKMGVSGTNGLPPSAKHNNYQVMEAAAKKLGMKDYTSARMAINSADYDDRPKCHQLAFCWSGCAIGAKWSTLYTEIPKAEQTGNFELRTGAMVTRIRHDKAGKVTGVVYRDENGMEVEQKARAVCVAGNVVETTRLLLNSKSSMFPTGLANRSDQVGRHYTKHMHAFSFAVMPGKVNAHRGTRQTGVLEDFVANDPSRGFVGGYSLQPAFGPPSTIAAGLGWGDEAAKYMNNYDRLSFLFLCGEDPPEANNRIRLHETDKDENGLPVPVLDYRNHANTTAMEDHSTDSAARLFRSLGAKDIFRTHGNMSTCHNMGVARMSAKPEDGVTNRWGQTHDVENLFVSDGSLFSTSGAPNPTLTIVALAIRQADHIAKRMSEGAL